MMQVKEAALALAVMTAGGTHPAATVQDGERRPVLIEGVVAGVVRDVQDAPVAGALVVLCDDASGLPLDPRTKRPFVESWSSGFEGWWFERTAADGAFSFASVPQGVYRLIAQSWTDVERQESPLADPAGLVVHLRGVADDVQVPGPAAEALELRPLGDAAFVYHRGAGNDDWFLLLSLGAPIGDPVLGFLGWRGPFLEQAIGYCRMERGQVIVRGLPRTLVEYAVFASDSNPGFAAGRFRGNSKRIHAHDTNVVAGWSDAIHDPPPALEPLCDEVARLLEERGAHAVLDLLAEGQGPPPERDPSEHAIAWGMRRMIALGPLDRGVRLPSGRTATVADLLAAQAYARLRR